MKEIDEKGLSEVAGGRSLNADERKFLEEKKAYYKNKLDSRKLSPKQYWDIMLQIDYYHRYVGLLRDDDTCLFDTGTDYRKQYLELLVKRN